MFLSIPLCHEELSPNLIRNGWGASAVDALSTAILMELPDVVDTILDHIPTIDFSTSKDNTVVSVFETTIRYIGGMLSGYDLLKGPYQHLAKSDTNTEAILQQAMDLAFNLSFAFDTPTGIPDNEVYFDPPSFGGAQSNGVATAGSLVLEWTRLSDLTNDSSFANLTQHAETYLLDPQPSSSEPWPGLVGMNINVTSGLLLDAVGGWGGGIDSFYEYLLKMYVYDPLRFSTYKDRWVLAADSSIEHLASHPSSRPDLTFLSNYNGTTVTMRSSHLACFDGGNFILGGLALNEQTYIDFGLELVESCHETYTATLTGIGPEAFAWVKHGVPTTQTAFYNKTGFVITTPTYVLRPEVIESFYYAYRATADPKYQEWSWDAFTAVTNTTRVGSGFSSITDVNAENGGSFSNFQESFLFAEFFKYAYLIQAVDTEVQVMGSRDQDWVLNTEGHPFKVFAAKA